MKKNLMISLKLTVICFVAVILLSIVYIITKDKIAYNERMKEEKTINEFFPDGKVSDKGKIKFKALSDKESATTYYYKIVDNNSGNLIGYSASTIGKGYGGKLSLIIAFNTDLSIKNIKMLKNNAETPGFGKRAEDPSYMNKFIGTNTISNPFPYKKNMVKEAKDTVTGATITFNGITGAVKKVIQLFNAEKK